MNHQPGFVFAEHIGHASARVPIELDVVPGEGPLGAHRAQIDADQGLTALKPLGDQSRERAGRAR
jgi:hypothetical protein